MSDKEYKELVAELEECQQQMFDRYDLDGSVSDATDHHAALNLLLALRQKTLNEGKELRQLCTNVCIKLGMILKVSAVWPCCAGSSAA
jgi:hypothetical protein